jgi:hypothetical protein
MLSWPVPVTVYDAALQLAADHLHNAMPLPGSHPKAKTDRDGIHRAGRWHSPGRGLVAA